MADDCSNYSDRSILCAAATLIYPRFPLKRKLRTSSLPLLQGQLARALEVEMAGIRLKPGDPMPEKITQWFDFRAEAFFCIKWKTHTKPLPGNNKCNLVLICLIQSLFVTFTAISILIKFYSGLLKDWGITVQQLYQDSLAKVYTLRLGGAEHVEVYNLERKTDDIKRLLEEKQRAGQEPRGEVDEGQQGEPRPQFSLINPQGL